MIKDIIKNLKVVKYVFKFCPVFVISTVFNIIASTVATLARVYLVKEVMEIIEYAIENNVDFVTSFDQVLKILLIYVGVLIVCRFITVFHSMYMDGKYSTIYIYRIQQMMYRKAHDVDFSDFAFALQDLEGTFKAFR